MKTDDPVAPPSVSPAELKAFRKRLDLNQWDMAEAVGYSRRHYQRMESGEDPVPGAVALVVEIATALRIETGLWPQTQEDFDRRVADPKLGVRPPRWYMRPTHDSVVDGKRRTAGPSGNPDTKH